MSVHKGRVLAIDDQPSVLDVLGRMLTHLGFEPVLATSAKMGFEKLRTGGCDALLLDLRMPEISGQAMLHELNLANCAVPVVAMSGQSTVDDVVVAFRENAADFLTKPFAIEQLAASLERALARRGSPSGVRPIAPGPPRGPTPAPSSSRSPLSRPFEAASAGDLRLPVLDPRIAELHSLLSREDCDMSKLAALIGRDPTLSAAVLRRVGSAGFRGGSSSGYGTPVRASARGSSCASRSRPCTRRSSRRASSRTGR